MNKTHASHIDRNIYYGLQGKDIMAGVQKRIKLSHDNGLLQKRNADTLLNISSR